MFVSWEVTVQDRRLRMAAIYSILFSIFAGTRVLHQPGISQVPIQEDCANGIFIPMTARFVMRREEECPPLAAC